MDNPNKNSGRYICPCCGYLTLSSKGQFEICKVCFWEDDAVQDTDEDYVGGANNQSLRQARDNYGKFGAVTLAAVKYVRKPMPSEIP